MKRIIRAIVIFSVLAVSLFSASAFAAEDASDEGQLQGLERIENIVYGKVNTGGLLLRLSRVERDLFGMELPGSLTEREHALEKFVLSGSASQPPLFFKMGVAEWITLKKVNSALPLQERVEKLETLIEDRTQSGALSARLERVIAKLMPNGVSSVSVTVPSNTVFSAKFVETLSVRNVKKGDKIALELDEDSIINGALIAARGGRLFAYITDVKLPRTFGRASEIRIEFREVEFLDGNITGVFIGSEAKKAMNIDSATVGAAGASLAGAVIAGPLGLASGLLVRGNDKQIKEGTEVFVETSEASAVLGYGNISVSEPQPLSNSDASPMSPSGGETNTETFQ
ncbi:hypothetical protein FACS1894216_09510 [Synergistales bacterium]|nr:hypothetical protein FACS1894216_09510 [Synergistales bacterium]